MEFLLPSNRKHEAETAQDVPAQAIHTVPTGLSGVPPSGPAMPLTASVHYTGARASSPPAIAITVWPLTAPPRASSSGGTPSSSVFEVLE